MKARNDNLIIDLRPRKAERLFWHLSRIPKSHIAILLAAALFNWAAHNSGFTIAYFSDREGAKDNLFAATDLDFRLELAGGGESWRTQTMGGWGAPAAGNNPGAYRDANFALAFPDGIMVGSPEGYNALFLTAVNVREFLPAGGPAKALDANYINPKKTKAGVLAGQTLALALNLGFDAWDPDFGQSVHPLADQYINPENSPCAGLTAGQVLAEANAVLAGLPSDFKPGQISDCAAEINERWVDGAPEPFLPGTAKEFAVKVVKAGTLDFQHALSAEMTGGSSELCQALQARAAVNGMAVYEGPLNGLATAPRAFSLAADTWQVEIAIAPDAPAAAQDAECRFRFLADGWQDGLPAPSLGFAVRRGLDAIVQSGNWGAEEPLVAPMMMLNETEETEETAGVEETHEGTMAEDEGAVEEDMPAEAEGDMPAETNDMAEEDISDDGPIQEEVVAEEEATGEEAPAEAENIDAFEDGAGS